jgi:peptide/nickel transport system ATP-binding protein
MGFDFPAIAVEDLNVVFRGRAAAVSGVSFAVEHGEVVTILGESGCGKTVTLKALMRLLPDHAEVTGEILVAGHKLRHLPPADLRRARGGDVSMLFPEPMAALDPLYTIGAQIAETIVRHEQISHRDATRRALALLERVAIPAAARRLKNYPHELSGGLRQRAMIALAVACNPSVLLADDPTTTLDITVQKQVLLLLRDLQQELGMSVLFATRDIGVAAEISDRIAVMYAGRIVEIGPVRDLLRSPLHPYTIGLLRSTVHGGLRGQAVETIPGSKPTNRPLPPGCAFAPRCIYAEDRCLTEPPPPISRHPGSMVRCIHG